MKDSKILAYVGAVGLILVMGPVACGRHPTRVGPVPCDRQDVYAISVGFNPSWSPDGSHLAFLSSYVDSQGAVVRGLGVVDLRTGEIRTLVRLADFFESIESHVWSPDGSMILVCWSGRSVRTIDVRTGAVTILIANGRFVSYPSWSHDGRYVYYRRGSTALEPDTLGGLYVFDRQTSRERPLLMPNGRSMGPNSPVRYSPDGRWLVCNLATDTSGEGIEVFVCDSTGANLTQLTKLGGTALNPQWSGKDRIFFDWTPGKCSPLTSAHRATWAVDVSTKRVRSWPINFGNPAVEVGFPFAIDGSGQRVAFTALDSTGTHGVIWAMDVSGANRRQLTAP